MFKIISFTKRKNANVWFFNNLYFPLLLVYTPLALTFLHNKFGTVQYNKTWLEISIAGGLSLVGINVLRTSATFISEKLDESKIPTEFQNNLEHLRSNLISIKAKLKKVLFLLTFVGALLYLFQVGQFVNATNNWIYLIFGFILIVTFSSIFFGRLIYLIETNFLDDENITRLLFERLNSRPDEYKSLERQLTREGL